MLTYEKAGVSVDRGDRFVQKIKKMVVETHPQSLGSDFGGFAAITNLPPGYRNPRIVTATDGVGTKLFVAQQCEIYDSIGIDLVAMCVNDVITTGARPWLFLDYFATSLLEITQAQQVVKGIAKGCKISTCALVGGETAEMPGLYKKGDFDLAGFCLGVVEGGKEVTGASVEEGDCIYAFGSSGAHSNGFSLIRAIMKRKKLSYSDSCEFLPSKTWGHVWLKPTEIYVPLILKLQQHLSIKAMAHITGGGILGNLGRVIPDGLCAHVQRQSWKMPAMFQWLQTAGKVPWEDMERTFNLGLGYMIVIKESDESKLTKLGKKVYKVGKIKKGLVRACWD